ncbi:MAG: hypothetical protein ACRD0P_11950 [Stackebrandtia sp.]
MNIAMPVYRHPRTGSHRETWVISIGFTARDDTDARVLSRAVTRRIADSLPGYDKNLVAVARESDPGVMMPIYCADDIYCVRDPDHPPPCQSEDGTNLDGAA